VRLAVIFVCVPKRVKGSAQYIKRGQFNLFDYHSNKWPSVPAVVCPTKKFYGLFGTFAKKSFENEATDFARSLLCTINNFRTSRVILSSDIGN
jgi:hypothetical protein